MTLLAKLRRKGRSLHISLASNHFFIPFFQFKIHFIWFRLQLLIRYHQRHSVEEIKLLESNEMTTSKWTTTALSLLFSCAALTTRGLAFFWHEGEESEWSVWSEHWTFNGIWFVEIFEESDDVSLRGDDYQSHWYFWIDLTWKKPVDLLS